jgi:hypothetical protein
VGGGGRDSKIISRGRRIYRQRAKLSREPPFIFSKKEKWVIKARKIDRNGEK